MKKLYSFFACLFILITTVNAQSYELAFAKKITPLPDAEIQIIQTKVDANGNTYVIGNAYYKDDPAFQGRHLFVTKINSSGVKLWTRHISEKGDSADDARALAIDSGGYVYVTGTRFWGTQVCNEECDNYIFPDIITIKYNPSGYQVWLNRFHISQEGSQTTPAAINVSKDGNIFITANLTFNHYQEEELYENSLLIQTISKYGKTTGSQIQQATLADAACLDNDGNLLVAGAFSQSGVVGLFSEYKAALLKFSKERNLIWSATYNNNTKSSELRYVACDSVNSIYVNGPTDTLSVNNYSAPSIITIKYNSAGQQRWAKQQKSNSKFSLFTSDTKGNTFLAASVFSGTANNPRLAIMKYNSAGNREWIAYQDSLSIASITEKNGLVYTLNYSPTVTGSYILTYNSSGKKTATYHNDNSYTSDIFLDKMNSIYLTGGDAFPDTKISLLKYNLNTNNIIVSQIQPEQLNIFIYPNPVKNVLNISFSSGTKNKNYKCFIYDVSGNLFQAINMNNMDGNYSAVLNVANLHSGIYNLKISDGINVVSKTFIKQ